MTLFLRTFLESLEDRQPPAGISVALQALWYLARDDWERAHRLVQDDAGRDAAWVHALVHRIEGDDANAGYWYRRAGRPRATSSTREEWRRIATTLCDTGQAGSRTPPTPEN